MVDFQPILASILGGFSIQCYACSFFIRVGFFLAFIILFIVLLYQDISVKARLITAGVVAIIIFLIKLLLWLLRVLIDRSLELTEISKSFEEDIKPDSIPNEVWQLRKFIENPKPSIDVVVSDLIASGIDATAILELVQYVQDHQNHVAPLHTMEDEQLYVISLFGKLHELPFSKKSIERVFPMNHSIYFVLGATVLAFAATYSSLSINNILYAREKWWAGILTGISIYSLLQPPENEPYLLSLGDVWTGGCRALAITVLAGLLRLTKYIEDKTSYFPVYGWYIEWKIITPYMYDIFRYGLLLMPFWIILGYIGHPVSFIVYLIEAFCRYAFGQNGVANFLHMFVQLFRGVGTTAIAWAILKYVDKENSITVAICLTYLCTYIPIIWDSEHRNNWVRCLCLTVLSTTLGYFVPYLVVDIGKPSWDVIEWTCFAWFLLIDIIAPFAYSCHRIFIFHMRIMYNCRGSVIVRVFSSLFVPPMLIAISLKGSNLNPLFLAVVIVHAVTKSSTEPQVFALAVVFNAITLPFEFDLNDHAFNLFLSLILAAKAEIFIPALNIVQRTRESFGEIEEICDGSPIIGYIIGMIYTHVPGPDLIIKFISLAWSFITGGCLSVFYGIPFFITPSTLRPFYFFDWPVQKSSNLRVAFSKEVVEHPVEAPVYTSASQALRKQFTTLARSGRLGYVNVGDIYLFRSEAISCFIQIIAAEPDTIYLQIRGLEYHDQTICHRGEDSCLSTIAEEYDYFPNFKAMSYTYNSVYDYRSFDIELDMFDVSKYELSRTFMGQDMNQLYTWFFIGFVQVFFKANFPTFDLKLLNSAQSETLRAYIPSRTPIDHAMAKYNREYGENDIQKILAVWVAIGSSIFQDNCTTIGAKEMLDAFKGSITFGDDFSWVYNLPVLYHDIIIPAVRLGVGLAMMSTIGSTPDQEDEQFDYVSSFLKENVVTSFESDVFQDAFFSGTKSIYVLELVGGIPTILRFKKNCSVWNVFQIKHEYVRAIWSNEGRNMLFYKEDDSERMSIQSNYLFLHNMIIQSCDLPIGYPAYVSEIFDSVINPISVI